MSTQISIGVLVPEYTREPAPFTKKKAVHVISELRLSSRNARGKGNRYRRRLCARRVLADFKAGRFHS